MEKTTEKTWKRQRRCKEKNISKKRQSLRRRICKKFRTGQRVCREGIEEGEERG
jgi:hypothetical protein